jgi:hypothetical protein
MPNETLRLIYENVKDICNAETCLALKMQADNIQAVVEPVVRKYVGAKMTIKF